MKFFDYIFFRSYTAAMKTKFKNNAEPRSIALVTGIQSSLLFSALMILSKFTGVYIHHYFDKENYNLRYLIALPLVFLLWYLNERHYRNKSKDNYELLRRQFKNSTFNKMVPFWIIFLSPFLLIFGIPFILSLIK